jgi:surface protein
MKDKKPELSMGKEESNQRNKLEDIKTDYFLVKLFDMLHKRRALEVIRYNKNIQQRLNKDKKDYEEQFSKIIIEIIPADIGLIYFIDNTNKEQFFHFYINENNEELKRNFVIRSDGAERIKVIIDFEIKSFAGLFKNCTYIKKIKFLRFNRKDINDMSYMFYKCESLDEVDFSKVKTNDVIDMEYMFYGCDSLKELNLSSFNTKNVTNMSNMFRRCSSLNYLNLSSFNVNNVNNMSCIFSHLNKYCNIISDNEKILNKVKKEIDQ